MTTRTDWLDAGLALLAADGVTALRIERLCRRLGVSKGSFYHHFAGIAGYRLDLLDHYESTHTRQHIERAQESPDAPARQRLDVLRSSVFDEHHDPALDVAVRAWASQDDDARAMQERVDEGRMRYLRSLWEEVTGDADAARDFSLRVYLLMVGAAHVVPPTDRAELARLVDGVLADAERARS